MYLWIEDNPILRNRATLKAFDQTSIDEVMNVLDPDELNLIVMISISGSKPFSTKYRLALQYKHSVPLIK